MNTLDMDPAKIALIKKLIEMQQQTGVELPEVNPEGTIHLNQAEEQKLDDDSAPVLTGKERAREYMGRPGVDVEMLNIPQPLPADAIQNVMDLQVDPQGRAPMHIDEKAKAFHSKKKAKK
jgi:hypothetical protein